MIINLVLTTYLVWRSEHEAIILLRLQQAPQSLEFMDLGEHSLSGQQHVEVAALIQHLADSSDGAVQLGQTLVQFLHLQVQRLGLHLTDLLNLKGNIMVAITKWDLVVQTTRGMLLDKLLFLMS